MSKEARPMVEQSISPGIREKIDNYVLQMLLKMVKDAGLRFDDMFSFKLNKCPHCQKQRIYLEAAEDEEYDNEMCVFCEKPVDERVVVFESERNKQFICLESEAEELLKK